MTITTTVDLNEDSHLLIYFKTKKQFHIFILFFFKSKPFDSAAFGDWSNGWSILVFMI